MTLPNDSGGGDGARSGGTSDTPSTGEVLRFFLQLMLPLPALPLFIEEGKQAADDGFERWIEREGQGCWLGY